MMDKLGEFSLNQKEYDKWMILIKIPSQLMVMKENTPTCLTCFVISLSEVEQHEEVHRYYQSRFQGRE